MIPNRLNKIHTPLSQKGPQNSRIGATLNKTSQASSRVVSADAAANLRPCRAGPLGPSAKAMTAPEMGRAFSGSRPAVGRTVSDTGRPSKKLPFLMAPQAKRRRPGGGDGAGDGRAAGGKGSDGEVIRQGHEFNDLIERVTYFRHSGKDLRQFHINYVDDRDNFRGKCLQRTFTYTMRGDRSALSVLTFIIGFIDYDPSDPYQSMPPVLKEYMLRRREYMILYKDQFLPAGSDLSFGIFKFNMNELQMVIHWP